MNQAKKIATRELRKGDVLEPDGSEVTGFIRIAHSSARRDMVLVRIKEPGKQRGRTFMLDAAWPLFKRDTI